MSDTKTSRYIEVPVPELVKCLCNDAQVGSKTHEEIKGALAAALVRSLSESIDRHERAATRLARQVFWLNIIFGAFTVLGTILAVIAVLKQSP